MLHDFNAWFRTGLETVLPFGFTDAEFKEALSNGYAALCHNKYQVGKLKCPLKLDDVGAVIIAYIAYFTMDASKDAKYYFDEYSDRKDPYRFGLVGLISKGAREYNKNISDEFTNDVLSYLYWAMKRGKCPKSILRPKDEERFKVKNWYIKEPYRTIVSMRESIYNAMLKVFEVSAQAVKVVIDGVEKVLDLTSSALNFLGGTISTTSFLLKNLSYILTGGIVVFAGVQIYGKNKNGTGKLPVNWSLSATVNKDKNRVLE
jgi:hypothetical protein